MSLSLSLRIVGSRMVLRRLFSSGGPRALVSGASQPQMSFSVLPRYLTGERLLSKYPFLNTCHAIPSQESGFSTMSTFRRISRFFNFSSSTTSTPSSPKHSITNTSEEQKHGEFVGSLDCGTTSVRFIIFDKYANIVAQNQLEFPQYYPNPGWHEHDAEEIQQHAELCIQNAMRELEKAGWAKESVKVIGITNQRETTVAWSRKTGKPLCKAIVWTDSRTKNTVIHYEKKLEEIGVEVKPGVWKKGKDGVEALREITGLPLSTYFSAIKLRWMLDHIPDVAAAHESDDLLFGTVESWVLYNLVGGASTNLHVCEVTNASRTLLLNTTTLQFEPCLLSFFGFRSSILPKIVSSSEVYGKVSPGVPVGGLVGDQQAALVGNKCLKKGEAKCTYGTGAFLLFCTGGEIVKSEHGLLSTIAYQAGPHAKPVYALEGSISVAGSAVKWLRDTMGFIEDAAGVNTLAAKETDTGGVYFVTAFSGLLAPYWDPGAGGLIIGVSQYTNPSHIARATLEANAFQTRAIIESMKLDSGNGLQHLKVDGGMTNGDLAMTVLADIGGFTVVRPEMRESTALGSALLAGAAIKLFGWDIEKPETLKEVNTKGTTEFKPSMEDTIRARKWEGWQRAVERSKGWEEGVDE
ncbi:glycerol kinase [Lentinula guzmanii]|uniref:glycerol kinase n=1 Tax=Lentinula guzmanii TaxID=2804957 RepID=A0AA38N0J2_9AGAR|nr:glycerol kinase [Lentinula guzmanii]